MCPESSQIANISNYFDDLLCIDGMHPDHAETYNAVRWWMDGVVHVIVCAIGFVTTAFTRSIRIRWRQDISGSLFRRSATPFYNAARSRRCRDLVVKQRCWPNTHTCPTMTALKIKVSSYPACKTQYLACPKRTFTVLWKLAFIGQAY